MRAQACRVLRLVLYIAAQTHIHALRRFRDGADVGTFLYARICVRVLMCCEHACVWEVYAVMQDRACEREGRENHLSFSFYGRKECGWELFYVG